MPRHIPEQKAARALQAATGQPYTACLALVRALATKAKQPPPEGQGATIR